MNAPAILTYPDRLTRPVDHGYDGAMRRFEADQAMLREALRSPRWQLLGGMPLMGGGQSAPPVGAQQQTPAVGPKSSQTIPFRRSTVERNDTLPSESWTMTASQQNVIRDLQGDGYMYSVWLHMNAVAATNSAAVAYSEDGPFNALGNPILKDVNGELVNLQNGWELYICNLLQANYRQGNPTTGGTNYAATTGSGASGGSFNFWLELPVGINRNNLLGVVGNQDRAQKYSLRTNLADSGTVYATAPTNEPAVILEKYYENYSVPLAQSPNGSPQGQFPDFLGALHFLSSSVNQTAPAAGSKNHYIDRIGNTVRAFGLVFRQGSGATPRAAADTVLASNSSPATIQLKVGSDTIFYETYDARRVKMFNRYGFDFPVGVLSYDTMHDNLGFAGVEHGNDWYHTAGLSNSQFLITYPSGYTANASNSLTIITDDLTGI